MYITSTDRNTGITSFMASGILVKDPKTSYVGKGERKFLKTEINIKRFSVKGLEAKDTFLKCSCVGDPIASFSALLRKGDSVLVAGEINSYSFTAQDGNQITGQSYNYNFIQMQEDAGSGVVSAMDSPVSEPQSYNRPAPQNNAYAELDDDDDGNLPF